VFISDFVIHLQQLTSIWYIYLWQSLVALCNQFRNLSISMGPLHPNVGPGPEFEAKGLVPLAFFGWDSLWIAPLGLFGAPWVTFALLGLAWCIFLNFVENAASFSEQGGFRYCACRQDLCFLQFIPRIPCFPTRVSASTIQDLPSTHAGGRKT